MRYATFIVAGTLCFSLVFGQTRADSTSNDARIAGSIKDENGSPVEASVVLSTQGFEQRMRTFPRETFRFSGLKGGKYILCAQPIAVNANPKDEPFVDSCLWHDRSAIVVTVRTGQDLEGVTVPVRHGVMFKVRVNDPVKQLSAAVGRTSGNQLAIMLTRYARTARWADLASKPHHRNSSNCAEATLAVLR